MTTKQDHAGDPGAYRVQGEGRTVDVATGGSTGNPLLFPATRDGISRQWAVWWRYRRWHGIDIDTWCGYFGGKPVCPIGEREVFWRYNVPGRQVMFSTPHLTPETVERYVAEINRRRLPWLHGLPSTLSLMTAHMEAARLQFGPWLRWITFGSENVPPGAVQDVLRVHGMRASDHYGMAEAVANMSQCPEGRLHVDEDFAHVEFLPYHDDSPDTEPLYRVVGTSFTNPAHAFVRYDTGDLVSGLEDECDCGRPGRTVSRLDGRTASYAQLPSGSRVGPISHVFSGLDGVAQGQVFVTSGGALHFHVVPGPNYRDEVASEIRDRVQARATESVEVRVETRSELLRGRNGKVQVVVQSDPPGVSDRPGEADL